MHIFVTWNATDAARDHACRLGANAQLSPMLVETIFVTGHAFIFYLICTLFYVFLQIKKSEFVMFSDHHVCVFYCVYCLSFVTLVFGTIFRFHDVLIIVTKEERKLNVEKKNYIFKESIKVKNKNDLGWKYNFKVVPFLAHVYTTQNSKCLLFIKSLM